MNRRIEIVANIWIDERADPREVVQEMDYDFFHPAIRETEIVDVNTEV